MNPQTGDHPLMCGDEARAMAHDRARLAFEMNTGIGYADHSEDEMGRVVDIALVSGWERGWRAGWEAGQDAGDPWDS